MAEPLERRIAIVVNPACPTGLLGNAIAVVAVGLGASAPALGGAPLGDSAGRAFRSSATVAVPVLQASPAGLIALLDQCLAMPGLDAVVAFPEFARTIHAFETYRDALRELDLAESPLAAIGVAGSAETVKRLTRGLALLR